MKTGAWKLTLEYDGSRYRGWQSQKNARSVQDTLRRAAEEVLGVRVEVQGAGRTDAGVHALGQVAHLKAPVQRTPDAELLLQQINAKLPADIVLLAAESVHARFHARHHARSRTYLYRISRRKRAFEKRYVWWVKEPLDIGRMAAAAALIPGRHDFAAFRAADRARPDESTVVVVESCTVVEQGGFVLIRITASHFLWKMVRRIVGSLTRVGAGEFALEDFRRLLESGPAEAPNVAAWTAPAAGLFLEEVRY